MYLAENKQESYIKPQNYEQTKKNKNKKKKHPYAKYNFEYNEETDTFTCPGGETLTLRRLVKLLSQAAAALIIILFLFFVLLPTFSVVILVTAFHTAEFCIG